MVDGAQVGERKAGEGAKGSCGAVGAVEMPCFRPICPGGLIRGRQEGRYCYFLRLKVRVTRGRVFPS